MKLKLKLKLQCTVKHKTEVQVFNLDENGNIVDPINHFQKDEPLTLDGILDRINQVGYDGLTQTEKDFLKNHK